MFLVTPLVQVVRFLGWCVCRHTGAGWLHWPAPNDRRQNSMDEET